MITPVQTVAISAANHRRQFRGVAFRRDRTPLRAVGDFLFLAPAFGAAAERGRLGAPEWAARFPDLATGVPDFAVLRPDFGAAEAFFAFLGVREAFLAGFFGGMAF